MADPWDAAFAAYNQAMIDLDGDGVPDVVRMPQGNIMSVPPPVATGQDRRQIQRRAMAGLEPTEQQNALLRAAMPQLEENTARIGNFGMELTGIPQVGRAGEAIGQAVSDPSLSNVTNAGAQTALAAFRPLAAAKILGAGYAGAAATDAGLLNSSANASANALPGLTPEQQRAYDEASKRVSAGKFKSGAERRQLEQQLQELRGVSNDFIRQRNAGSAEEYTRSVERAEGARDKELSRSRRFSDTEVGKMWDTTGGFAPAVLAMGAGAASRAATGGGSAVKNYLLPAGIGGATGAVAINAPLAYNSYATEPDNPEKRAYEAYARELPQGHPRKEEFAQFAAQLPSDNPVRTQAQAELYDPQKAASRIGWGLLEGVGGGLLGADIVRMPGRLVEGAAAIPERVRNAKDKAASQGGGKGNGGDRGGNPPPEPISYQRYPQDGDPARSGLRETYRQEVLSAGRPLEPSLFNRATNQAFAEQGGSFPNITSRVKATNANINEFVSQNGRLPISREEWATWIYKNKGTLAIPAAIGAGAAAEEPVNYLLQQYRGG